MSFTQWLESKAPAFMQKRTETRRQLGILGDGFAALVTAANKMRRAWFVRTCEVAELARHGAARNLERYPNETDDQYRARLITAYEIHRLGGTAGGVEGSLTAAGFTGAEVRELFDAGTPTHDGTYTYNGEITYGGHARPFEFDVVLPLEETGDLSDARIALVRHVVGKRKRAATRMSALVVELQHDAEAPMALPRETDAAMSVTVDTFLTHDGSIAYDGTQTYDATSTTTVEASDG